jgi:hypothetical protein
MRYQLASLLNSRHKPLAATSAVTDEVSEHEGALLVRLRGGSAMQVRLEPGGRSVLIRTVPIAKATKLEGDLPWQVAPGSQLQAWIQSGSAIGQWLLAQGIAAERVRLS